MFNVLVDTCVWLDLAKDTRQAPVIGVVEEMVKRKLVSLIVPSLVLDEFCRNRAPYHRQRRRRGQTASPAPAGLLSLSDILAK